MAVTLMACYGSYGNYRPPYEDACSAATSTAPGGVTFGNTSQGTDGEAGSCVGAGAREEAFQHQPDPSVAGQPGTFVIRWNASANLGVYVRSNCNDHTTELACTDGLAAKELAFHVDAASTFTIFFDGKTTADHGSFDFQVEFRPDFFCGDGRLGSTEECDEGEGGSTSCTSDCRVSMCDAAIPLEQGVTAGDTSTWNNRIQSSCGGVPRQTALYAFTPTAYGRLDVWLEAGVNIAVSAIASCALRDLLSCDATAGSIAVTPGNPIHFAVASTWNEAGGPFELGAHFTPSCGDGIQDPWEACDDGDTIPGDGCDATCNIEQDFYCAAATPLVLGDNAGDNTAGVNALAAACTGQLGRESLYAFAAPSDGILVLDLTSTAYLGLYVLASCPAGPMLGCADNAPGGENELLSVHVSAGETYTVVVDGTSATESTGPFTLKAHFIPQ